MYTPYRGWDDIFSSFIETLPAVTKDYFGFQTAQKALKLQKQQVEAETAKAAALAAQAQANKHTSGTQTIGGIPITYILLGAGGIVLTLIVVTLIRKRR